MRRISKQFLRELLPKRWSTNRIHSLLNRNDTRESAFTVLRTFAIHY